MAGMSDLASDAHTFLFADLESSTRLWKRFPTRCGPRWSVTTPS
jgi:class 3 adenylate cyclase